MGNKKEVLCLYSHHAGKIFSNLSILFLVLSILSVLMPILTSFYYIFLIVIVVITFGLIFVWYPNFSSLWGTSDSTGIIIEKVMSLAPIFVGICMGLAILSIVFLLLSKKKTTGRIVFAGIVIGISILAILAIVLRS